MLGERLMALRKDADLTQDQLAEILNINKHSISSYERNKSEPPDAIKLAIAQYFNVSIDYLLGLVNIPAPVKNSEQALRLPSDFPKNMIPELLNYAEYLMYKKQQQ